MKSNKLLELQDVVSVSEISKVFVQPHRLPGVFVARGAQDALVTKNLVPGESVYNEKRISVEVGTDKIEYRVWNPYRSKIAASVVGGIS